VRSRRGRHLGSSGFVYIWRDRNSRRFYIGCHWGREDDDYVCSSHWMMNAYKVRPDDFKRRILKRMHSRSDLLLEEQRWLGMIKDCELRVRYYNIIKKANHLWWGTPEKALTVGQKISKALKGVPSPKKGIPTGYTWNKGVPHSVEARAKMSAASRGRPSPTKGKHLSEETKQKLRAINLGRPGPNKGRKFSEDSKRKMRASAVARWRRKKFENVASQMTMAI
jgi:hypothetical protein